MRPCFIAYLLNKWPFYVLGAHMIGRKILLCTRKRLIQGIRSDLFKLIRLQSRVLRIRAIYSIDFNINSCKGLSVPKAVVQFANLLSRFDVFWLSMVQNNKR